MILIPKIIHLVFLNKDDKHPEVFVKCVSRIKRLHPQWDIRTYNEDDAHKIIDYYLPHLSPLYNSYTHLVQKADLLRVILVYIFGGFYLDMDMYCLKPLDELRRFKLVLGEEKTLPENVCKQLGLKERIRVANYMFGSVARHLFWLYFLHAALRLSLKKIETENDILETTGPGLLSNLYGQLKKKFDDIVLLANTDRNCLADKHHKASCYFGNYAAHLHQGTWRWGKTLIKNINREIIPIDTGTYLAALSNIERAIGVISKKKYNVKVVRSSKGDASHNFLYSLVKELDNSSDEQGKNIFLVCGEMAMHNQALSPLNFNVLYTTLQPNVDPKDAIININTLFRVCIVTSVQDKQTLTDLGVTIPVYVVVPAFTRYNRNFDSDEDSAYFNVGFILNHANFKYHDMVVTACLTLQEKHNLPIRLKIYADGLRYDKPLIEFIDVKSECDAGFSNWYKDVHCNIFLTTDSSYAFKPYESLYLGIPTIISYAIDLPDLIEREYFDIIELDKTDTSNILKNNLLNVYNNYPKKQRIAANGAAWIEDKWLIQDTQQQILSIFDHMLDAI